MFERVVWRHVADLHGGRGWVTGWDDDELGLRGQLERFTLRIPWSGSDGRTRASAAPRLSNASPRRPSGAGPWGEGL